MVPKLEFSKDYSKKYRAKFKVIDEIGRGGFGTVYLIKTRHSNENNDHVDDQHNHDQPDSKSIQFDPSHNMSLSSSSAIDNHGNMINDLQNYDENNQMYAMKVIRISRICKTVKQLNYAKNEMKLLASIDHPLIVKLFYAFHCSKRLYLIMELLNGGDLASLKEKKTVFTETEVRFYSASILIAIEHLHSMLIIYRDLKPENVMFDVSGRIKLVDFGLCRIIDSIEEKANTICGTIEYLAPEVVNKKSYDRMIDYWSLGVLIYDLLLGHPPFSAKDRKKLINQILSQAPNMPNLIQRSAANIIKGLLTKNPEKRLGKQDPQDVRNHKFYHNISFQAIFTGELESPAQLEDSKSIFISNNKLLQDKKTLEWSLLDNHSLIDKDTDKNSQCLSHTNNKNCQNDKKRSSEHKITTTHCYDGSGNFNKFPQSNQSMSEDIIHIKEKINHKKSDSEILASAPKNSSKLLNNVARYDLDDPKNIASLLKDYLYISPLKKF